MSDPAVDQLTEGLDGLSVQAGVEEVAAPVKVKAEDDDGYNKRLAQLASHIAGNAAILGTIADFDSCLLLPDEERLSAGLAWQKTLLQVACVY